MPCLFLYMQCLQSTFATANLKDSIHDVISRTNTELLRIIGKHVAACPEEGIDMTDLYFRFTFDVAGRMFLGEDLASLR